MEIRLSIQLAETDLEAIENTIAKALSRGIANGLVRVARILAKEGLLAGLLAQPEAQTPEPGAEQVVVPEPPAPVADQVAKEPEPLVFPWDKIAKDKASRAAVQATPPKPQRKKNRSIHDVCKRVGDRPSGFIPTEKAYEVIGGSLSTASAFLSTWIHTKQVEGVIVHNAKVTPTKGMNGGKLFVNAEQLRKRNELRMRNAKLPARKRTSMNAYYGAV